MRGTVLDASEAAIPGAGVTLTGAESKTAACGASGDDGVFTCAAVPAGTYRVMVERRGFDGWETTVTLAAGQRVELGEIALAVSRTSSSVEVQASGRDIAEAQMQLEEKQRVLGVFPNFYASYAPDPEPLSAGEKMRLAYRFSGDPVAFAMAGFLAGVEQSRNQYAGYGRGVDGYSKRFGATYADGVVSTMVGQAVLPVIFHQDPRYFVKGTGSVPSRTLYALASTVMCKGDNGRWQVNYSNIVGNVAGAGASNLYYPAGSRASGAQVVQTAFTATALGAIGGLFQEFFLHRMTPRLPDYQAAR
ncbi:MAG TPA: carboxypeptidase-like regulatory domain-containing protein [Acidobacteriaceae bacterium]|nr:carboxypeptidase-like regulatory domain-containing protein [Acidobacteriaceae bacterium]